MDTHAAILPSIPIKEIIDSCYGDSKHVMVKDTEKTKSDRTTHHFLKKLSIPMCEASNLFK